MSRSFLAVESARLGPAQNFLTSTATASSAAFSAQTYQIRICADVATRYRVGDGTPSAVPADTLLPANWVEYVTVTPGQRIAAILGTGTGSLSVTEIIG